MREGSRQWTVNSGQWLLAFLTLVAIAMLPGGAGAAQREWQDQVQEIQLSNEELQKLDTFEAHSIGTADKVFAGKGYRQAAAEYESFTQEFPRSKAVPYALVRKARCLHLQGKRYEAIKQYAEVLDSLVNSVSVKSAAKYGAAALFFTGLCHWENGDDEKAVQAWSLFVNSANKAEDTGYSKEPLAAWALNRLADHLLANSASGRPDKAVACHQQVAADFRRSNPEAANYAIAQVVCHWVHAKPDEPALRAFYQRVGGFGPVPTKTGRPPEGGTTNLEESRPYWQAVRMAVHQNGRFPETEAELRARYYAYWAGVLRGAGVPPASVELAGKMPAPHSGRFPDWDDYQIDLAHFQLMADKDTAKWMQQLDAQFDRYQKPDDLFANSRVIRWIRVFRSHKPKAMQYYNKLVFEKMTNGQIRELMAAFFDEIRDPQMARNVFAKLRLDELSEDDKVTLARYLWPKDGALVEDTCTRMIDKELGQAELLRFYHSQKDAAKGVPLANVLATVPRFAKEALFKKAQLLQAAKKFSESIQAYQQADSPPESLWGIADCYAKMGKVEQAVVQLREVESFFKDHAPEAALRIARLYNETGKDKLYIAALRSVLKKYPESGQSSEAHQLLERLGVKMGGGVDAE